MKNVYFINTIDGNDMVAYCISCDDMIECISLINDNNKITKFNYEDVEKINDFMYGNNDLLVTKMDAEKQNVVCARLPEYEV